MKNRKINWKYAVGETLIVILGISIAFMLENWRERRQEQNQSTQYLGSLKTDLEEEILLLEENNRAIQAKLESFKRIRPHLGRKLEGRDSVAWSFFELANLVNFHPVNTTYQTLINSGDLKLIRDFELRRSLEEHYAFHQEVQQDYERIESIHKEYLGDFLIHHLNYQAIARGDFGFMDDPLLPNILASMEGANQMIISSNNRCIESNRKVLQQIDNVLKP